MANQQKGPHQHWVRRIGHNAVLVFSILFSIVSGCSIGWYYSTLDGVAPYQWVITDLIAVAFSGFGFFLSRALAYCMHHKGVGKGVKVTVILGACFFEVVELASCFSEAAYGIKISMAWLNTGFDPLLGFVLHVLPFVVLPIFPVFTILCGQLDVAFDLQNNGQKEVPSQQVQGAVPQYKPSSRPAVPNASSTLQPPVQGVVPGRPAPSAVQGYQPPVQGVVPGRPAPSAVQGYQPPVQGVVPGRPAPSAVSQTGQVPVQGVSDTVVLTESLAELEQQKEKGGFRFGLPFLGRGQDKEEEMPTLQSMTLSNTGEKSQ